MSKRIISVSLIVLALSAQLPLAAQATNDGALQLETASLDPAKSRAAVPPDHPMLYGSAKRQLGATSTTNAQQSPPQDLRATDNAVQLQAPLQAAPDAYKLAAQKLSKGGNLSADEYRALGVGCTGLESYRTFFQKIANVTAVYAGSPAAQAGIRVGDQMICKIDNDAQARANPSQPLWAVRFGKAGTATDVTLLRSGQPVTLTLIRMNIEDIPDSKARHMWEQVIRRLGYPEEGTFSGTSLHNLSQTK